MFFSHFSFLQQVLVPDTSAATFLLVHLTYQNNLINLLHTDTGYMLIQESHTEVLNISHLQFQVY